MGGGGDNTGSRGFGRGTATTSGNGMSSSKPFGSRELRGALPTVRYRFTSPAA